METILMDTVKLLIHSNGYRLNPFYIMETILIVNLILTTKNAEVRRVLIHSTSWKLFWSLVDTTHVLPESVKGLNPFYIMETILMKIYRPERLWIGYW